MKKPEITRPAQGRKPGQTGPTPAVDGTARALRPETAAFLRAAAVAPRSASPGKGRLIFALDATLSRQPTWDLACALQSEMFDSAARVGSLDVQLVYFRGHGEARASRWVSNSAGLKRVMTGIACQGGLTQIGRVLEHAEREAGRARVDALVYVGDAMEEDIDRVSDLAGRLGVRGTKAFMFHEGQDPVAARAFREIARLTRGVYLPFDAKASGALRALLAAVGAYAAGGRPALEAAGTDAARRLLADLS